MPEEYTFELVLDGVDAQDDDHVNALYDAGCDDATFGSISGVQLAEFTRRAPSFADAVTSAIRDVERAVAGLRVARVNPEDCVSATEIAQRTRRSREGIRLLADGERGPGDFPSPEFLVNERMRVWRWCDVAEWFKAKLGEDVDVNDQANFLAALNALLEARRRVTSLQKEQRRVLRRTTLEQIRKSLEAAG